MRVLLVLAVIGRLTRLFCLAFLAPFALALWDGHWNSALWFAFSGLLGGGLGTLVSRRYTAPRLFHRDEAMAVVAGTWMVAAGYAAIPYLFYGLGVADAYFEAMSGLTTTGATVLQDFSLYDRPFFLWRAMTQWFGGVGVIALFVVILPRLGIAGRQLFFAEASTAPGEDINPQIRRTAGSVWGLYLGLTGLCAALLIGMGMSLYDGLVHALTTLSAGGFSPNGQSIAGYQNPGVEWVLVVFMFLAGASFPLQLRLVTGKFRGFFKDDELRVYALISVGCAVALALILTGGNLDEQSLRQGFFQSTSVMSSTGFASTDYNLWSDSAKAVLVFAMLVGGCAGSAAGGPKVIRHVLVARNIFREIRQTLHPRAVLPLRYKGSNVPDAVLRSVVTLATLYVGGYLAFGILLVFTGNTPTVAFTAALACLGNVGPGFESIGPMGNFAAFSSFEKAALTVAMWIGRLEIMTVLALLHPHVWQSLRFSRK
ncbi:MAG: trk system potassium uptake protein TrkH [Myxococcota bacterium]